MTSISYTEIISGITSRVCIYTGITYPGNLKIYIPFRRKKSCPIRVNLLPFL